MCMYPEESTEDPAILGNLYQFPLSLKPPCSKLSAQDLTSRISPKLRP